MSRDLRMGIFRLDVLIIRRFDFSFFFALPSFVAFSSGDSFPLTSFRLYLGWFQYTKCVFFILFRTVLGVVYFLRRQENGSAYKTPPCVV